MRKNKLVALIVAVSLFAWLVGCNAIPQTIKGIFASKTPTPTNTPTVTPTATSTCTPTATPRPPVSIGACPQRLPCGGSVSIGDLYQSPIQAGVEYRIQVPYDIPVSFRAGWIAQDESTLQQNLDNMTPFFEIDGQSYFLDEFMVSRPYYDNGNNYYASWLGVVIRDWKIGEPHRIRLGYTVNNQITDGWDVFQKGTVIEYLYLINPVFKPTATITPSPTPIPTATRTPRPTTRPVTPTPSCSVDSVIYINNKTGGTLTIYLSGPAKFTFYVSTGSQQIKVCRGTYSYTAYGCGGASKSGNMSSGETHDFWCQ